TLPHKVDSAKGERRARLIVPHEDGTPSRPAPAKASGRTGSTRAGLRRGGGKAGSGEKPAKERPPGLRSVGGSVLHGLQANAAHRALSGFLIFFLAF
ncbi:MFS transporter, partial [Streptomyces sp. SID7982]|nr:MFS transporter [Streptomyces sp. SID7982]